MPLGSYRVPMKKLLPDCRGLIDLEVVRVRLPSGQGLSDPLATTSEDKRNDNVSYYRAPRLVRRLCHLRAWSSRRCDDRNSYGGRSAPPPGGRPLPPRPRGGRRGGGGGPPPPPRPPTS